MSQEKIVHAKLIIQQCIHAKLKIVEESESCAPEFVQIGKGLVAYVCFMKNATQDTVAKMVDTLMSVKLSKNSDNNLVSILDLPGSILIVPQATIGGKLKGKRMQYHRNIDKSFGKNLYELFVSLCIESFDKLNNEDVFVKCGTYGNLQVLTIDTNGPYTHVLEF